MMEQIGDDLIIYLKGGYINPRSFLEELNLNINNLHQLLNIHFLLRSDVLGFVLALPRLMRNFRTSTSRENETFRCAVKGSINWGETIKNRCRESSRPATVFTCSHSEKYYNSPENLVLKEFIKTIYSIYDGLDIQQLKSYDWFKGAYSAHAIIKNLYERDIYLSRISSSTYISDRMVEDAAKSRMELYRMAAKLLRSYRRIANMNIDREEANKLLQDTFVEVCNEETLFELYWVINIIKKNQTNARFNILSSQNTAVCSWINGDLQYDVYHNSTGSKNLKFCIPVDEIYGIENDYLKRKIKVLKDTREISTIIFKEKDNDTFSNLWSGRPDIIIEIRNIKNGNIEKIILGEVKYTEDRNYAIEGLKELLEYMNYIKNSNNNYVSDSYNIIGMLFLDKVPCNTYSVQNIKILNMLDFDEQQLKITV